MAEPNGAGPDTEPGPDPSPQAELRRLRSEAAFHQRLRDLTVAFSGGVSSSLSFEAALQTLTADANTLLGAARTSVWLHQRRARRLILAASSDTDQAPEPPEVETGDPDAPAARGMRLEHPELFGDGPRPAAPRPPAWLASRARHARRRSPPDTRSRAGPADHAHPGAQPADLGGDREHPAARGGSAPAPPPRGHLQLDSGSGRRHRQPAARRADERCVRGADTDGARGPARSAAPLAGRRRNWRHGPGPANSRRRGPRATPGDSRIRVSAAPSWSR